MRLVIIGAGRMGIRHAEGAGSVERISTITLVDISSQALSNASVLLNRSKKNIEFFLLNEWENQDNRADIGIVASTANNRLDLLAALKQKGCTDILIEKPLGQSFQQVQFLLDKVAAIGVNCFVNLNMRLYPLFEKVKNKISTLPQFRGPLTIVFNVGSIGIGANGIHYLDLFFFLLSADKAQIQAAEIDETTITSGRGSDFKDFGGWCVVKFFSDDVYKGKVFISISAESTAFGSMEMLGPHGRIFINEIDQVMTTSLRKEDSTMPMNRYAADYLPAFQEAFVTPPLSEFTRQWLDSIGANNSVLPSVGESTKSHRLLFDWLSFSKTYKEPFPIT